MSRRAWRLPMVLLLPLLLIAGLVVDRRDDREPDAVTVRTERLGPSAPGEGSVGSTWYCAAGTATGVTTGDDAGLAEQNVLIANLSDAVVAADLSIYTGTGEPFRQTLEVPAQSRAEVRVSDLVKAPWASVIVEAKGGAVAVEHHLQGPDGRSLGPCATSPSSTWYFPAGTSRPGTRNLMVLFNPFPDEASVDLAFETDEGSRTPGQFRGLVVPGSGTTVVDIGEVVTERREIATTVLARNGRVIAEQVMVSSGREIGAGLTSVLGAPAPAPVWVFPDGPAPGEGQAASVAVLNPDVDAEDAEVEVQVFLDDPATNGSVEPFTLSIPGGRYASQDLFSDARIPSGVGYWVLVESTDGVPVVAEMLQGGGATSPAPGFAATLGTPVVAEQWYLPAGAASSTTAAALVLVNPAATGQVTVRVVAHVEGRAEPFADPVEIVVPAGTRVPVDLGVDGGGRPLLALEVRADGPLVVGRRMLFANGDLASGVALPVAGTELASLALARPEAFDLEAPVPETVPEGSTEAPESTETTETTATTSTSVAGGQ